MKIVQAISVFLLAVFSSSAFARSTQQRAASVLLSQFETVASTRSDFLLDSESRMHTHFIIV